MPVPPAPAPLPPLRLELTDTHPSLVDAIATAFKLLPNPPAQTVSAWADEHRYLSPEDSAEPGRWRTARMEPMRGIMDAFNDPLISEIVVPKATQVGWTAVLGNVVGYVMDRDPGPVLMVMPTDKLAEEWSKNRLAPMLRDTPRLRGKVKDAKSRDSGNTIMAKTFPGGRLAIIGANAPANLASRPIRIVLCDEVDRYPASAGSEGDPMMLASKRTATFWNRKLLKGGSPTIKGQSAVERDYNRSDKRRYFVPCPDCGEHQILRWEQVRWDKRKDAGGKTVEHRPETAHYQCEACGTLWTDGERWRAIASAVEKGGGWKPTAPFSGIAGFHLSQLYSSWVTLREMVIEFLTAYGKLPGTFKDLEKCKVFTNTVLAETWDLEGETVDAESINNRGEPFGPDDLPEAVQFASAGVDVQSDRLEVQVVCWGAGEECWAALYAVIPGDPARPQVWDELNALLLEPLKTAGGRLVRIRATCIDTGGHHGAEVHAFCSRPGMRGRRVYPIKGDDGPRPIWPVRHSYTKNKRLLWIIGVDTAKDSIYGRLKIRPKAAGEPNPGFIHFPIPTEAARTEGFGPDYFTQLTVEKVVTEVNKRGKPQRGFVLPAGKRNEALDTFAYALAARQALPIRLKPVKAVAESETPEHAPAAQVEALPSPAVVEQQQPQRPMGKRRSAAEIGRLFNRD